MYDAVSDLYCYPDTTVLQNLAGIREQSALDDFEAISTAQRADEPHPLGSLSVRHYRAIHHHLFQDVYPWAVATAPSGSQRAGAPSATLSISPRKCGRSSRTVARNV